MLALNFAGCSMVLVFPVLLLCDVDKTVKAVKVYDVKQANSETKTWERLPQESANKRKTHQVKMNAVPPRKSTHKPRSRPLPKIPSVHEQIGTEAILPCDVSNVSNKTNTTVTWVKNEGDNAIIELSSATIMYLGDLRLHPPAIWTSKTIVEDKRFLAIHDSSEKTWHLHVRYTKESDKGLYQCHIVSEDFKFISNVSLNLVEANAVIIGEKVICINGQKPLRLSCVLHNSTEPPDYIFWYHNERVINYDLRDNAHVREGDKGSELIFPKPDSSNAGNYTCVPSNARQASVFIRFEADIPSTCELPYELLSGGKKSPHLQGGDHILNMPVLISTFHLCRWLCTLQT